MNLIADILIVLSSLVICLTMFVRANEQRVRQGLRWHLRLLGFVLAGAGAPITALTLILVPAYTLPFLTTSFVGVAFVFLTTPNQRPWHEWIWKGSEQV